MLLYYRCHPQILFNLTALHPFYSLLCSFYTIMLSSLFIFILCHSSRAGTTCCSTRLVLLAPSFLLASLVAPFLQPIVHCTTLSDTSSRMHLLHAYALHIHCLIPSPTIECYFISISAGLEVETLIEIGVQVFLHAWREERFVLGTWGNHVACAQIRVC